MPLSDTTKIGLANRFKVKIDNGTYDLGSWAKVDGLEVTWDLAEYRAGDGGNNRWYFPGNTKYQTIKLTRAACEDTKKVKEWLTDTSFKHKPQAGTITLFDSNVEEVMSWDLKAVVPAHWKIEGFDAGASKIAQETLELTHAGFLDDEISY
ncbi:MAG TPA: phage tail protein [Acidimicrobiia bacterium]|nr:phage tail protein [Acidimicrobiia bacterium]